MSLTVDRDRRIGRVVVLPEHDGDMLASPPVYPIGTEGVITRCEELADGRYHLVLQGRRRFRIGEELAPEGERLYRMARISALEDPYPEEDREAVASHRRQVMDSMRILLGTISPERAQALDGMDDITFVNALAQSIDFATSEKQGLVDADSIPERYVRLANLIRFRVAETQGGGAPPSDTVH